MVYVKIQPYQQFLLHRPANKKLVARLYDPSKVLECIRDVAYRLEMPDRATIHLIFHASKLKDPCRIDTPSIAPLDLSLFATIGEFGPLSSYYGSLSCASKLSVGQGIVYLVA